MKEEIPPEDTQSEAGNENLDKKSALSEEYFEDMGVLPSDGEVAESEELPSKPSLEMELQEANEKYHRLAAEFDNYKKQKAREQGGRLKFASEKLLKDFLSVIDDLERAQDYAKKDESNVDGVIQGLELVHKQCLKVLLEKDYNVTPVEVVVGGSFDPAVHQSVGFIDSDEYPSGTVAEENQKGYMLHDRLLRPSLVKLFKSIETGYLPDREDSKD